MIAAGNIVTTLGGTVHKRVVARVADIITLEWWTELGRNEESISLAKENRVQFVSPRETKQFLEIQAHWLLSNEQFHETYDKLREEQRERESRRKDKFCFIH